MLHKTIADGNQLAATGNDASVRAAKQALARYFGVEDIAGLPQPLGQMVVRFSEKEKKILQETIDLITMFKPEVFADIRHKIHVFKGMIRQASGSLDMLAAIGRVGHGPAEVFILLDTALFTSRVSLIYELGHYFAGSYIYQKEFEADILAGRANSIIEGIVGCEGNLRFMADLLKIPAFCDSLTPQEKRRMEVDLIGSEECNLFRNQQQMKGFFPEQTVVFDRRPKLKDVATTMQKLHIDGAAKKKEIGFPFGLNLDDRFMRLKSEIEQAIKEAPANKPKVVLGAGELNDIPDSLFSSGNAPVYLVDIDTGQTEAALQKRGLSGLVDKGRVRLVEADLSMVKPTTSRLVVEAIEKASSEEDAYHKVADLFKQMGTSLLYDKVTLPAKLNNLDAGLVVSSLLFNHLSCYQQFLIDMQVCFQLGKQFDFNNNTIANTKVDYLQAFFPILTSLNQMHPDMLRQMVAKDGLVYFSGFIGQFKTSTIKANGLTPEELEQGFNILAQSFHTNDMQNSQIPGFVPGLWKSFAANPVESLFQWSVDSIVFNDPFSNKNNPFLSEFTCDRTNVWYWENRPDLRSAQLVQSMLLRPR